MAVQTQIQVRRGTASSWTSTNPTLAAGEWGLETDTGKYKVGTGSAVWTSLGYASILPITVTTKGDLIAATGSATVSRLAVGSDGYQLVADSSQSTGLGWAGNSAAGKNAVINGGFDIWQRGTSIAVGAGTYTADRWMGYNASSVVTVSRQATSDTTNLPNIQYCARVQRNSGATATTSINFGQPFETVNSIPYAGKQVTFSFYARKGANYSSASDLLYFYVQTGTGTDQNSVSGSYTGGANTINSSATLTTTWQRFTATATIPTTTTEIGLQFSYNGVGTAGAADYFEITGVQLELGSSATPFSRAGGNIQGELAACQRYYWRQTASGNYSNFAGIGQASGTTSANLSYFPPVTMRVKPSSIDYANIKISDPGSSYAITSFALDGNNTDGFYFLANATMSGGGATLYRPCVVQANNNSSAYLGFSAEL